MSKYIDADLFKAELEKGHDNGDITGREDVEKLLDRQPAADVREVRRGKWKYERTESNMAVVKCTECGQEQFAISGVVAKGKFCPSCGAEMEVE